MTTTDTGNPSATPGDPAGCRRSPRGGLGQRVVSVTASYTCAGCDDLVSTTLQLPATTSLTALAADLAPVEFEAEVLHILAAHIDGLGAA